MASIAFALPIIPGKEETDRAAFERFVSAQESEAFAAWNRSHGISRHMVWHQKTPNGTMAIVMLEADDIGAALGAIGTAQSPLDQRFRDLVKDVHGVDLAKDPGPEVVPVLDWQS